MSSAPIRYAYLKGQTWLYRRNYPKDLAALLVPGPKTWPLVVRAFLMRQPTGSGWLTTW
jgi:hypothetical protein